MNCSTILVMTSNADDNDEDDNTHNNNNDDNNYNGENDNTGDSPIHTGSDEIAGLDENYVISQTE